MTIKRQVETMLSTDWVACYIIEEDFRLHYELVDLESKIHYSGNGLGFVITTSLFSEHQKQWLKKYFGI